MAHRAGRYSGQKTPPLPRLCVSSVCRQGTIPAKAFPPIAPQQSIRGRRPRFDSPPPSLQLQPAHARSVAGLLLQWGLGDRNPARPPARRKLPAHPFLNLPTGNQGTAQHTWHQAPTETHALCEGESYHKTGTSINSSGDVKAFSRPGLLTALTCQAIPS